MSLSLMNTGEAWSHVHIDQANGPYRHMIPESNVAVDRVDSGFDMLLADHEDPRERGPLRKIEVLSDHASETSNHIFQDILGQ